MTNVKQSIEEFLEMVENTKSTNTHTAYRKALKQFAATIKADRPIETITENEIVKFIDSLTNHTTATVQLYTSAAKRFAQYAAAMNENHHFNLTRLDELLRQRARRPGKRLPPFPKEQIDQTLEYMQNLSYTDDENANLTRARDQAFLITLADTGLRVHEACNLLRGDIDWENRKAIIIGKGNKQALVKFSPRSIEAIQSYLSRRAKLDGNTGKPLATLPVFARHDHKGFRKTLPMSTTTGRNIVTDWTQKALGNTDINITPHSFRHYFVTMVLQGSGNLKLAQQLARHSNIAVTERYAHISEAEAATAYDKIFGG